MAGDGSADDARATGRRPPGPARRLRGFGTHLAAYFAAMAVLVPVNFLFTPENPWFVLPMVGWGAVLAVHAAYAMELFKGSRPGKPR